MKDASDTGPIIPRMAHSCSYNYPDSAAAVEPGAPPIVDDLVNVPGALACLWHGPAPGETPSASTVDPLFLLSK